MRYLNPLSCLRLYYNHGVQHWLDKSLPAQTSITLNHKNVFILPSRFGFFYLGSCVLLYFIGANYQNNLILFLLYFLLSFMLTCLFLSYQNLAGLTLTGDKSTNQFAKQECQFRLRIKPRKKNNTSQINFSFQQKSSALPSAVNDQQVLLYAYSNIRGYFNPGRITLSSNFPCGLFSVWTHLDLNLSCLLFPEPVDNLKTLRNATQNKKDSAQSGVRDGNEEFSSLKEYRQGESLKSVAWKQVAQGRGWYTKQFEQPESACIYLDLADFDSIDIENSLSNLCYRVLDLTTKSRNYGLKLGNYEIQSATGELHKQACLKALALYERHH